VLPAADLPIARSAKLSQWAHGTPPRGRNLCASGAAVGRRLEARRSFARPLVHPAPKITSACFVPQDYPRLGEVHWQPERCSRERGSAAILAAAAGILPAADGAWMSHRSVDIITRAGRRQDAGSDGLEARAPLLNQGTGHLSRHGP